MLTRPQLADIFDRLGTPPAGQKLNANAREQVPVREVKSRVGQVIAILTSRKMRRGIQSESGHVEFTVTVSKEHTNDVLEYYAQPCELRFIIDAASYTSSLGSTFRDTRC
ncbi:hypothetical protein [Caballeronia sp. S22]|uniref:hypothetical protein n=1 Tax=Caballeronia sp. S22 TaxID=3137182 RepID=UPI003530D82A